MYIMFILKEETASCRIMIRFLLQIILDHCLNKRNMTAIVEDMPTVTPKEVINCLEKETLLFKSYFYLI